MIITVLKCQSPLCEWKQQKHEYWNKKNQLKCNSHCYEPQLFKIISAVCTQARNQTAARSFMIGQDQNGESQAGIL